ncbi:hypothetical protein [Flavobacterium sp. I3-2]|uniref:hypothetical protein n=1 Tax=Flavobacterium sp. I3-2 TaxID=2748319 RepID=UPI0015AB7F18|nr:hypothetical protein [Flavobacterium sp. I3-2]
MKSFITIAFLAIATIANAQPGRHKEERRDYNRNSNNGYQHSKHKKNDYKKGRKYDKKHNHRDCDYRVERELSRYDFLNLSRDQRSRLQVSLNFMITNDYNQREYERRLRSDLYHILNRNQYRNWENRAYNNSGNTFIFNFNS